MFLCFPRSVCQQKSFGSLWHFRSVKAVLFGFSVWAIYCISKDSSLVCRRLRAFTLAFPGSEYWLIGNGPERGRLERVSRELRLNGATVFWGSMSREHVFARLADCDVMLFPSLHDSEDGCVLKRWLLVAL